MVKTIKILLIASLFGFLIFFLFQKNVKAGSEDNVTGFAWSDKTSWISFNCLMVESRVLSYAKIAY